MAAVPFPANYVRFPVMRDEISPLGKGDLVRENKKRDG